MRRKKRAERREGVFAQMALVGLERTADGEMVDEASNGAIAESPLSDGAAAIGAVIRGLTTFADDAAFDALSSCRNGRPIRLEVVE